MTSIQRTLYLSLIFFGFSILYGHAAESAEKTKVTLVPTIHRGHLKKGAFYSTKRLEAIITELKPDVICTEITRTSLININAKKPDKRITYFPEYTKAIIPLREKLGFIISPCSAWTPERNFQTIGVKGMDAAHYKLIAKALDKYSGKNIVITFGSGHINGLILQLKKRTDIEIIDFRPELAKLQKQEQLKKQEP